MTADWLAPDALVVPVDYATYCAAEVARDAALFLVDHREQFLANRDAGLFDGYPEPVGHDRRGAAGRDAEAGGRARRRHPPGRRPGRPRLRRRDRRPRGGAGPGDRAAALSSAPHSRSTRTPLARHTSAMTAPARGSGTDIVVVGAGAMGAWTALQARRQWLADHAAGRVRCRELAGHVGRRDADHPQLPRRRPVLQPLVPRGPRGLDRPRRVDRGTALRAGRRALVGAHRRWIRGGLGDDPARSGHPGRTVEPGRTDGTLAADRDRRSGLRHLRARGRVADGSSGHRRGRSPVRGRGRPVRAGVGRARPTAWAAAAGRGPARRHAACGRRSSSSRQVHGCRASSRRWRAT